jgi:hypothetical protein
VKPVVSPNLISAPGLYEIPNHVKINMQNSVMSMSRRSNRSDTRYPITADDSAHVRFVRLLRTKGEAANEHIIGFKESFHNMLHDRKIYLWVATRWWERIQLIHRPGQQRGVEIEPTPPRTPEPNGVSKRHAGYINSLARAMIIDASLTANLWPYATETAVSIVNRLIEDGEAEPPVQKWRKFFKMPNPEGSIDYFCVWGCRGHMHKRIELRL